MSPSPSGAHRTTTERWHPPWHRSPDQVTLADLATKDDLKHLVSTEQLDERVDLVRREFKPEIGSAVNMIMGELGRIAARQEEQGRIMARLVAASDGVVR